MAILSWVGESVSGYRKKVNDDSFQVFAMGSDLQLAMERTAIDLGQEDVIMLVVDGMGGHCSGDFAARLIMAKIQQYFRKILRLQALSFTIDYHDVLVKAIADAHTEINQYSIDNTDYKGMGAAMTLLWFAQDKVHIAHVGDTRLYQAQGGNCWQITKDHNYIWQRYQRQKISERAYRQHPKNSVLYEVMGGGYATVNPDIFTVQYDIGDRFLLCSDGLVAGLWQKHFQRFLSNDNDDLTTCLANLFSECREGGGGYDDTTAVIFDIR